MLPMTLPPTPIGPMIDRLFGPLVTPISEPSPKKAVGILVGLTIGGVRSTYSLGQVDLNQGGSSSPEDIVMFIGSNTKVFTATLLAVAPSQTAVSQYTHVNDLLPTDVTFNQPNGDILLWHLATHSAGLPKPVCGHRPAFGDYPFASLGGFLDTFVPAYPPGEYWHYSNPGFALLGVLLSHGYAGGGTSSSWDASYQNWPALVIEQVTKPLNMTSTQVDYSAVAARVAQGYAYVVPKHGSPTYKAIDPPKWNLMSAGLGAGALSSTSTDMLAFLEAQISPPEGYLGLAIKQTQAPHPESNSLSMGLGWQISNHYLDKDGAFDGYETYMAFDPTHKMGVFAFANTSGGEIGGLLGVAARNLLGELRRIPAKPSKFPQPSDIPECPRS